MADPLYYLTAGDRAKIRKMLEEYDRSEKAERPRQPALPDSFVTPDVYLALTPPGGIPATESDANPSYADCTVKRILQSDGQTPRIAEAFGQTRRVFNPFETDVPGDTLVVVTRDKFGTWIVSGGSGSSSGGGTTDSAGFTQICEVRDGYGTVTGLKYRKTYADHSFECLPLDLCCLPTYWCVANAWTTFELACCDPEFRVTRILEVTFTNKTGAATRLPDKAYIVHVAGGMLWTGGPGTSWVWKEVAMTGSVTFACVTEEEVATDDGLVGGPGGFIDDGNVDDENGHIGDGGGGILDPEYVGLVLVWDIDVFGGETRVEAPCDFTGGALDLGTLPFSETITNECGAEEVVTGTVDVTVASWEVDDVAVSGVVSIGENISPPWDAGGPWKSEEVATDCCQPSPTSVTFNCCALPEGETITLPGTYRVDFDMIVTYDIGGLFAVNPYLETTTEYIVLDDTRNGACDIKVRITGEFGALATVKTKLVEYPFRLNMSIPCEVGGSLAQPIMYLTPGGGETYGGCAPPGPTYATPGVDPGAYAVFHGGETLRMFLGCPPREGIDPESELERPIDLPPTSNFNLPSYLVDGDDRFFIGYTLRLWNSGMTCSPPGLGVATFAVRVRVRQVV